MRVPLALVILGLGAFSPGCALLTDSAHSLSQYVADSVEDVREGLRNRRWAEAAWQDACAAEPGRPPSDDYAAGFKRGFADYLDEGGTGEPPALPPPRYRRLSCQTPQGYAAIEEWFAGYRRGAEAARQSGLRQWITGPTSLRPPGPPPAALGGPEGVMETPLPPTILGLPIPDPAAPEILPEALPPPQPAAPEPADEKARPLLQPPLAEQAKPLLQPPAADNEAALPPLAILTPVAQEEPAAPPRSIIGVPEAAAPAVPAPVGEQTKAPSRAPAAKAATTLPVIEVPPRPLILNGPQPANPSAGEARRGPVLGPARGGEE